MKKDSFTATGWTNGSYTYGLSMHENDRDIFFKKNWENVSLTLIGRTQNRNVISNVTRNFWDTCPELTGVEIRDWLFKNNLAPWEYGRPPKFQVKPRSEAEFEVSIID